VTVEGLATDETLILLKLAFLVLLYVFIVLIVRSATKDIGGSPQESIILGAKEAAALRAQLPTRPARFLVLNGPGLRSGSTLEITAPTTIGRGPESGIRIDGDDFASSSHARIESRQDGVWVEDLRSTNGTFVNGARVTTERLLQGGDVVRIGQTELRLER
jgi:pSer/pThr/pTyr-binding forkhead associated (FHA) protein